MVEMNECIGDITKNSGLREYSRMVTTRDILSQP